MTERFLVTGGAGYVGSHLVAALLKRGAELVILDNLRTGHAKSVPDGVRLVRGDLDDRDMVNALLQEGRFDGLFHFASLTQVGESMRLPYRYILENAGNGIALIEACVRHGVGRFVLSSTAALFGRPQDTPIPEDAPVEPGSPYGESKAMIERALFWAGEIHGLRSACLRYFNAAGADPEGRLGEDHRPETHLIPLVIDAALGRRPPLDVFGDDYPTPDGTCVRDYVHVSDLADAHLLALGQLAQGNVTWNLGNGTGHSVMEVIRAVERVAGRPVPHQIVDRRPGDPPWLVAASAKARQAGWQPRFNDLDDIVRTAFIWREAHPKGYGD